MKPITVNYQKVFQLAPYVNERIGVDMQLDDGDSPLEALAKAKDLVEKFHRDGTGSSISATTTPETPAPTPIPIVKAEKQSKEQIEATIIAEIYSCTDIDKLESYSIFAKTYPGAKAAYDEMYQKLKQ